MVTALFDVQQRSKRQVVKYDQIPKVMVDAVLAIEDRRFFEHGGVNFVRMAEAAWIDVIHQRHEQGGSTLTMQLSRGFFLTPEKTVKRKLTEMLIAEELEHKFNKQQIFEIYANWVDLGQRGSFAISGFAEASQAYFNKDLKDITLPEAALLAGIIQRPSYLSPYRHPERALERRNLVLDSMVETHAITRAHADKAKATPLKLAPPNVEASDAPYFVDLVRDTLIGKMDEREMNEQSYRIYTTLDPELQKAAAQAVEIGMKLVDDQVTKRRTKRIKVGKGKYETKVEPGPQAQVALVAMNPHTGEVLALVGGRNYAFSQLDHAVAKRPTGSIFKPFVYAAAMNTAVRAGHPVFTPASIVDDQPSTFAYGDQIYEPRNYKEEYHGDVTARYALAHVLKQRHRETGGRSRIRQSRRSGQSRRNRLGETDSRHGAGRLRRDSPRHGGRLHRFRQFGSPDFADPGEFRAQRRRRRGDGLQAGQARGAGSPRGLRDDQHDGGRDEFRHCVHGAHPRLHRASGRQDRHFP